MYLIIYISVDSWVLILYFGLYTNTSVILFSNHPSVSHGELLVDCSVPLTWPHCCGVLRHLVVFRHPKMPPLHFYICCLRPRISHFSKKLWSLFLENRIRNQELGARGAPRF